MVYATPCTCLGRPLRFEVGSCFTCGRLLESEVGAPENFFERAGYRALAAAVDRTERKIHAQAKRVGIEPGSAAYNDWIREGLERDGQLPRRQRPGRRRRVVIDGGPSRALQSVRGAVGVC